MKCQALHSHPTKPAKTPASRRLKPDLRMTILAASLALIGSSAYAEPTGGQISVGSGSIAQTGTTTTITQSSQNLAINWQSFGIGANEAVNFVQPNASAIALNRVLGQDPSQILGSLSANGQVFILNPNGVLFGTGSQVNVGGLVASTLSLSDADFIAGKYSFSNGGTAGAVVNQGTLTAAQGGYIALLAPEVRNEGVISATLGTALLAAGDKVTLTLNNGSLLSYSIDQGALNALAENKHLIQADGGQVFMSAKAANALSTAMVNNTGIIQACTVQNVAGVIMLMGDMQVGTVNVGGTLDASAPNGGNGGFIETSAAHVNIGSDLKITTAAVSGLYGTWLIDPQDYNVAASGGDITGAALSTALVTTSVILQSSGGGIAGSGNVNINDAVSWSTDTTLTLTASANVNINADITATGDSARLVINPRTTNGGENPGVGGGSFILNNGAVITLSGLTPTLSIDGLEYTVINSLGLQGSTTTTDLQGISGGLAGRYALGSNIDASLTSGWNSNAGFAPIGTFSGTFDGLGHTISNLTVTRGLFSATSSTAIIRNVGLLAANVSGNVDTGALVGMNSGLINNTYSTGSVTGSGAHYVGGLVGWNQSGTISNSYSTVNVIGSSAGGLIGSNSGAVSDSYATGSVTGSSLAGGLVAYNSGSISNTYATGLVAGGGTKGGLVASNAFSTITTSYWDNQTTGQPIGIGTGPNAGATGYNTANMMLMASYTNFNIANVGGSSAVWRIYEGNTTPWLISWLRPLTLTANNDNRTYSGAPYSGGNGVTSSVANPNPALSGGLGAYGGTSQLAVNPGIYTISASGFYSVQQGYDISYAPGTLIITPLITVPEVPNPPLVIDTPWDVLPDEPPLTITNWGIDLPPTMSPPLPPVAPPPVTAKPEPPPPPPPATALPEAEIIAQANKKQLKEGANILFDTDKSEPKNIPFLNKMADAAIDGKMKITIFAHTDIIGSAEYNRKLSLRRALRVKALLMARGVAADRIQIIGEGRGSPAADNKTVEGRSLNRRAVIKGIENEDER